MKVPVEDVSILFSEPLGCQEPVSQMYQLAILALRLGQSVTSQTLFLTALQRANCDLVALVGHPACVRATAALAEA